VLPTQMSSRRRADVGGYTKLGIGGQPSSLGPHSRRLAARTVSGFSASTLTVPEDTLVAGSLPSSIIRYTVARQTRSRSATSRTVSQTGLEAGYCDGNVKRTLEFGPSRVTRWDRPRVRPGGSAGD
jgi:hypothetical protein